MHVWPWEKGRCFFKEYKTNWTRQSVLVVSSFFYFAFHKNLAVTFWRPCLDLSMWGFIRLYTFAKQFLHVLIEYESYECAAIACSWPRHLCGWLIHSCENWLAFGMEVLFWCVLLSLSCFSFFRNYWIQEGVGDIFLSSLRRGKSKTMAAQSEVEELQLQLESKICSIDLNGLVELAAHLNVDQYLLQNQLFGEKNIRKLLRNC